jgi:Sulfotransferase family
MPLNETHLGLITLLFPQSPILHVIRHPLDVVLSVFSNHLTHGFQCAFALETAALHFRRIVELVEHYRGVLTMRYLPVRYEDLVDDQEATVRRALDFIGEPFDDACLSFHENRRYARTASYAQVTEPLYDRSRYRYRHYLDHLKPVIEILEPVIARLGYGV